MGSTQIHTIDLGLETLKKCGLLSSKSIFLPPSKSILLPFKTRPAAWVRVFSTKNVFIHSQTFIHRKRKQLQVHETITEKCIFHHFFLN